MQPGDEKLKRDLEAVKHRMAGLPRKMGDTAVLFTKQRFREQGWAGSGFTPWRPRKAGAKRNKGRALLVDSGRLIRSIRVRYTTKDSVPYGTDVPYAKANNEGLRAGVTIKAHSRKSKSGKSAEVKSHTRNMRMPKRQFMGDSPYLQRQIKRVISAEISKALKNG